ncbi:hypothetical protein BJ170DRAFT_591644 [Xylariales sp. AK1849]|nr:hypothetical protein BJ170DRAFT_591644 [Xylariales sp. AK1849]
MAAKTKSNPLSGMHTAGIFADLSVDGPIVGTLVLIVDRAKNLPNRKTIGKQDPYCAARLGKEAKKTTTDIRGGQTPKWDQELRFTVHDSPDYYQLKLSVFNDDKKTDLIGETWIDLRDIILPGGGQNDQWQGLTCKGKYAGEIRIEITYYDSRPKPEKPAAKAKPVASGSEQDGSSGSQRTPVKRRPLPTNPGSNESASPAAKAPPAHVQTPPRPQPNPIPAFIPNQSPLQAVEYNTPPPTRFSPSEQYSSAPEHGNRYSTPPAHREDPQHRHSIDRNDKFSTYEDDRQYNQDPYSRSYEPDSRTSQHHSQPGYESASPTGHHPRQSMPDDDRPPPPPVHRVRNNSGNSQDMIRRSIDISPQVKATPPMPMRHDVLRSEAHRNSISFVPSPASSNYPGRPVYRPYDSAPDMPKQLTYEDPNHPSPPRHHSYDSTYDSQHRSMQPTVEDVPESWTPPKARSRHNSTQQYDDTGYGLVPSPAPLSLGGRASAASGQFANPSPVQSQKYYGSNNYSVSNSTVATRDYPRGRGHSYSTSNSFGTNNDPYGNYASELDNSQVQGSSSYALPPVPPTLVPGVDPSLSMEIANRFHEDRNRERRYTQPAQVVAPTRGRQHSETSTSFGAQPSPHVHHSSQSRGYNGTMVAYSGDQTTPSDSAPMADLPRHTPSPNPSHTIKRKSVSPAPPQEGRRLSGVPFGPDSYDELNPSVASAKDESRGPEYTNAYGKIVTADGREVDPSDHLPMDTWAPEPEPKGPKQPAPDFSSRPTPSGAQPMPPSGRRQIRVQARPQSMAVAAPSYINPDVDPSPPPSAGRNRLQKKNHRMSTVPAPISAGSSPLGPATTYQRNSTPPRALVRASTFDYENQGPPYASPSATRGSFGGNGPPIPAKVPLMSGGLGSSYDSSRGNGGGDEWALMEEMSRIDIGTGRARRHGGY